MNLGKLQSLKLMNLDGNKISYLPDELGQLVRLERLSISGNLLTSLPTTIGSLRNPAEEDPSPLPSFFLFNGSFIFNMELSWFGCLVLSSYLLCFDLNVLQFGDVDNLIEDLPSSVCNLSHLKSLCFDNNNVKQIPSTLLKDCKVLQNLSLHGNPISMDQFQQMDGFEEFEVRRKKKFDKQIDSNVMISSKGLDEGVDI
ncbi:unnamed protein product [Lupinus luteus]|uniref:Uncharacterized protein n=1 Tax=Lupinus luteus TaxID=3873 RepID=A0AAV1XD16_LUPLU